MIQLPRNIATIKYFITKSQKSELTIFEGHLGSGLEI